MWIITCVNFTRLLYDCLCTKCIGYKYWLFLSLRYSMCGVGILRSTAVHQEVPEDGVELLLALPSVKGLLPALCGSPLKRHFSSV